MSHYWFNKKELLEKAEEKYHNCNSKEKGAKYYQDNKDAIKQKTKSKYKNLPEEEKEETSQYSRDRCQKMKENENFVL